ncbi:family 16 glycoside hydrolase [Candidatus Poribacteria bacterium]
MRGVGPSGGDEQTGSYALTLKAGSDSWADYELSCDMYHMDNDYAGLFVRYVDELNYFRVWTKQEEADQGNNTTFGMDIVVDGTWTHNFKTGGPGVGQDGISGTPIPAGDNIQQMQWFNVTAEVVGDTVTMYMEGEKIGEVTDPALAPGGGLAKGKIALYNATNPMAYDNVTVTDMAVEPAGKLATTWSRLRSE